MVAVIEDKLAFGRDQVVTSTQASKNFGEMRKRARNKPLFVSDRNDGIDTVIIGFDEFEEMAVELERLRQEHLYAVAAERIATGDIDSKRKGIPAQVVIGQEAYAELLDNERDDSTSDSELFE